VRFCRNLSSWRAYPTARALAALDGLTASGHDDSEAADDEDVGHEHDETLEVTEEDDDALLVDDLDEELHREEEVVSEDELVFDQRCELRELAGAAHAIRSGSTAHNIKTTALQMV
jgi:hypothetical protein